MNSGRLNRNAEMVRLQPEPEPMSDMPDKLLITNKTNLFRDAVKEGSSQNPSIPSIK